jgi:predicted deacylase
MNELGMPVVFSECGATGFGEKTWEDLIQKNITGIRNVMISVGMIEDKITEPESQYILKKGVESWHHSYARRACDS